MKPVLNIVNESLIDQSFAVKRMAGNIPHIGNFIRLHYHGILVVEEGKGILTVDDRSFKMKENTIFLWSKGQVYHFGKQAAVNGFWISFGDCFWEKAPSSASNCKAVLFNNAAANQRLEPNQSEMAEFRSLCNSLLAESEKEQYTNQIDVMAAYLKIMMIKLANIKLVEEETFDSQDYIVYRRFMELLSEQFRHFHAVSDYAEMLNITPRRLSELCKRCSNASAKEIINGQIIAEAKRLLQFSSCSVKDIAYQLNFHTSEQFSHFFKKNTEIAPVNYRSHFINIGIEF